MDLPEIDVEELARHPAEGALVFDVRENDAWGTVPIDGTTLIRFGTVTGG